MAIEPAAAAEEIVPSKLTKSRKKAPKGEIALGQARVVANIIDGFNHLRAAHRAQQQHDRRLPIEDMASASAAAAPPESSSAAAAPRGRAPSRTQSNSRNDRTPEYRTKGGQLGMMDKRGRSATRTPAQTRDETPEFPLEGTVLISDVVANKKAKRNPQDIMRKHYKENRSHFRAKKKVTLPISKRRPT